MGEIQLDIHIHFVLRPRRSSSAVCRTFDTVGRHRSRIRRFFPHNPGHQLLKCVWVVLNCGRLLCQLPSQDFVLENLRPHLFRDCNSDDLQRDHRHVPWQCSGDSIQRQPREQGSTPCLQAARPRLARRRGGHAIPRSGLEVRSEAPRARSLKETAMFENRRRGRTAGGRQTLLRSLSAASFTGDPS